MKVVKAVNPAIYGDRQRVERAIKELEPNKKYNIYILEKGRKRTLSQNAYMWAVPVQIISDYTGYEKEAVHEYLIDRFAPLKFVEAFGKIIETKKRTSDMTTVEFMNYIEKIRMFSLETGSGEIPLPNQVPDELYVNELNR